MSKFRVVFGEPVKRGPNGLPVHEKGKPDWRGTQNTKVEAASAKEAADKVRKMHPGCEVFESVTDPLYKIADALSNLAEIKKRASSEFDKEIDEMQDWYRHQVEKLQHQIKDENERIPPLLKLQEEQRVKRRKAEANYDAKIKAASGVGRKDALAKVADAFTELRKDADALVSRRDALERGRKDAPSTAEEQKKWKIRGVYPDGRKLEFSVLAFDHSEAKRKAETKKGSGKITDVVCLS